MDDTPTPASAAKAGQPGAQETSALEGIAGIDTSGALPNKAPPNTPQGNQDVVAMPDKNTDPEPQVGRHGTWDSVKSFGARTNTGFSLTSTTTDITEPDMVEEQHASGSRVFSLPCRSRTSTFHSPLSSRSPSFAAMDRETVQLGRRPAPPDGMPDTIPEGETSTSPKGASWRGRYSRDPSHPIPHPLSLSTPALEIDEMDAEPSTSHDSPDPTPVQRRAPDNQLLGDIDTFLDDDDEWTTAELSSSQISDSSDQADDAVAPQQEPDGKLIQDVCDGLLKHLFGIELPDLAANDASLVRASVSYCMHELFRVVPASLATFPPISESTMGSGESSQASAAPTSSNAAQGTGGQGTTRRVSKRRSNGGQNPGGDGFDDGNGPGDGKRPKHEHSQAPQGEDKCFSCPYRKRNPTKFNVRDYQSCAVQSFPDISQLKRHVKVFHGRKRIPTSACPRCKRVMSSEEELHNHIAVSSTLICDFQEIPPSEDPEDGIDARTEDLLNGRRANTKVDSWEILWRTLFPSDQGEIPDPVFVPPLECDEVYAEFHLDRHREDLKSQIFEEERNAVALTLDTSAHVEALMGIYQRHIETVFEACRKAKIGNAPGKERRKRAKKTQSQEPTDNNHLTPSHTNTGYGGDSGGGSPSSLNTVHSGGSWSYVDQSNSVQQTMASVATMPTTTAGFHEMQEANLTPTGVVIPGPINNGNMVPPTPHVRGGYHSHGQPHHYRGPSSDSAVGLGGSSGYPSRHHGLFHGQTVQMPVTQQAFPGMNFTAQPMASPNPFMPPPTMSGVNSEPTLMDVQQLLPFSQSMNPGAYRAYSRHTGLDEEMDGNN